jgi:predicted P-loop ATPase
MLGGVAREAAGGAMIDLLAKLNGVAKSGDGWTAKCPAHDDREASLSIAHRGGKWLVHCHAGCEVSAVCQAIGVRLSDLFDERKTTSHTRKPPSAIFAEAQPISPTFPYFAARGLDVGAFPDLARAARYAPRCWHKETKTEKPALIAAATDGDGATSGIQRLYLTGDCTAKAGKPMSLGRTRALAIRLGPPAKTLFISEGLEDAMTAQQAVSGASAWAAIGASNMPNLVLPETVKNVVFLGQNDPDQPGKPDPAFAGFVARAASKFAAEGRRVGIAWPPVGVKDINDLVKGKTGEDLARGYAQARAMLDGAEAFGAAPAAETRLREAAWLERALTDDRNRVLSNLANVLTAMRFTPQLAGMLAYDELLRAAVLVAPLPLTEKARHASRDPLPRPVVDEDVSQLQEWLQWNSLPKIGRDIVHQAVDRRAREFPFHKLREWLESLKWDGKPRLDKWLTYYLGAEPSEYHAAIGKMFLIGMVARVFEPGCKADYVLILQGAQGELKSEACRVLGGEYFSDDLPDIRSKDANQYVRGLWLIELPELSAMSRSDVEHWKAFISRTTERYRPFYGRRETIEPRQCLFIGTTNREEYLQDETGGRRFWPVRIGKIDLDALKHDRDQLFAEAVHCHRNHERWWPDQEFERQCIAAEQEARFEADVWEPLIDEYLHKIAEDKTRVCDVARVGLAFDSARIGTADARRIRRVLHRLGWRQVPTRATADRFYYRPKKADNDDE